MDFDEWAEQYALDDEPCTRESRRQDCAAAWDAAVAAVAAELAELRVWREKAFEAHPNLDLDIAAI